MISNISDFINSIFEPVVNTLAKILFWDVLSVFGNSSEGQIPLIVIWLFIGAVYFTIKMRFINIRGFIHAVKIVTGKLSKSEHQGEVSHFKALSSAVSGTVGLGNIAGVAIAISVGGPGATLWMIIAGFLGMSMKFVESTLAVKYREIDLNGRVHGGPMYYIKNALAKKGQASIGKILGGLFAILLIIASFGGGNMFQSNQAFSIFASIYPSMSGMGIMFGIVFSVLAGLAIIGGIKSISNVASKLVPFMALIYILVSTFVILLNINELFSAIKLIVIGAFAPAGVKGGIIGVMVMGIRRAVFSNEAGVGSSPVIHATAKTDKPIKEGLVAMLEPFLDTVLICSMTALVLIFTGFYETQGMEGVTLTSSAFESEISWAPYFMLITVLLFAYSSLISWSYYGLQAFNYLFGHLFKNKKVGNNIYNSVFLFFTIVGSSVSLSSVLDFSDMMLLSLAFPNILVMFILGKEVKKDLTDYLKDIKTQLL